MVNCPSSAYVLRETVASTQQLKGRLATYLCVVRIIAVHIEKGETPEKVTWLMALLMAGIEEKTKVV